MAKRRKQPVKKEVEQIEVVDAKQVTSPKKKLPTKPYVLKMRVKVSGQWKEKGEKISLTEDGYRFFRSKKYV